MSFQNPGFPAGPGPNNGDMGALSADASESGKDKKEKKVSKGIVNRQILIAGIFAVLIGIVAWLVVSSMNSGKYVVVAKENIGAGAVIQKEQLDAIKISPDAIVEGAIEGPNPTAALETAAQELSGGNITANQLIPKNGQITKLSFGAGLDVSTKIPDDQRLVSFATTVPRAVAGKLKPGDRVDVVATVNNSTSVISYSVPIVSITPSENLISSAANKQVGSEKDKGPDALLPGDPIPGIYVLQVPTADGIKISGAQELGRISLLFQGPNAVQAPSTVYTPPQILAD